MRKLLGILFLLLFAACEQDKGCLDKQVGYLVIERVSFSVDGEIIPLSRAVDAGLQVQIRQNGALLEGHDYVPGTDFSKRIVLPVGAGYTVKAFTPDQAEAPDEEAGHPVYSVESEAFDVVEADITTISLVAPQINVGVAVRYDEAFTSAFTDITLTVTSGSGRSVTIEGTTDTGMRYFNLPVSGELSYTLRAVNADGENMEKTEVLPVEAKNYTIQISI